MCAAFGGPKPKDRWCWFLWKRAWNETNQCGKLYHGKYLESTMVKSTVIYIHIFGLKATRWFSSKIDFLIFFIFFTVLSLRHGYFLQSKYHSGRKLKISINISKSWVYIMGRFKFVRVNSNNWCDLWTGSKWKPLLLSYDSIEYNNSMNLTRYLTSFLLKKFIE